MKHNALTKNYLCLGVFIINPLLGVISSYIYMKANVKLFVTLFSIFMGLCAYHLVPYDTMDLASHYNTFELLKNVSFQEIIDEGVNVFLYSNMKVFYFFCINKEWIPATWTFLAYFIILYVLTDSSIKDDKCNYHLFYLLVIINISFLANANGLRSGLASSFIILTIWNLEKKRKVYFLLSACLSILIHSFSFVVLLLLLLTKFAIFMRMDNLFKVLLFVAISLIVFGVNTDNLLSSILGQFTTISYIDNINDLYVDGERWGIGREFTESMLIGKYVNLLPFYFSLVYLLFNRHKNFWSTLGTLLAIFCLLTINYSVISERYQYIVVLLSLISFLKNESRTTNIWKCSVFLIPQIILIIYSVFRFRFLILDSIDFMMLPLSLDFYKTITVTDYIKV